MKTILLTLDNPAEFDFTRTILSKLGFTVLSKKKGADMHALFQTSLPDLVITSILGSEEESLKDFSVIRAQKGLPKFIWVGADSRLKKLDSVQKKLIDCNLSSPVQPEKLVRAVCQLTSLDEDEYMEKYHALYSKSGAKKDKKSTGEQGGRSPLSPRGQRYKDLASKVEAQNKVFSAKDLKRHTGEAAGELNTEDLLEQKRHFVKALFGTRSSKE